MEGRYTDRTGDLLIIGDPDLTVEPCAYLVYKAVLDLVIYLLCELLRITLILIEKKYYEFVSAVADGNALVLGHPFEHIGKGNKNKVSYIMTEGIVVILEIIQVKIKNDIYPAFVLPAYHFRTFAEAVSVGDACQMVCDGRLLQPVIHVFDHNAVVYPSHHFAELAECEFQDHQILFVHKETSADRPGLYLDIGKEYGFGAGTFHYRNTYHRHDMLFVEGLHHRLELCEILVGTVGKEGLSVFLEEAEDPFCVFI